MQYGHSDSLENRHTTASIWHLFSQLAQTARTRMPGKSCTARSPGDERFRATGSEIPMPFLARTLQPRKWGMLARRRTRGSEGLELQLFSTW